VVLGLRPGRAPADHSSLTRIRQRLGLPIFRRFFEHVVDLCQDAGLVWGKEVLADATMVPGTAATASLQYPYHAATTVWSPERLTW
jgi:hypothetical protein